MRRIAPVIAFVAALIAPAFAQKAEIEAVNAKWIDFFNKGDFAGVPMSREALKVANSWDPASDDAAGQQCRGYGAPVIMRLPGRLHISWQDDQTLKVEADAGTQTRARIRGGRTSSR